jgi:hypothetical protein
MDFDYVLTCIAVGFTHQGQQDLINCFARSRILDEPVVQGMGVEYTAPSAAANKDPVGNVLGFGST